MVENLEVAVSLHLSIEATEVNPHNETRSYYVITSSFTSYKHVFIIFEEFN